jgi:hypothetical protein
MQDSRDLFACRGAGPVPITLLATPLLVLQKHQSSAVREDFDQRLLDTIHIWFQAN